MKQLRPYQTEAIQECWEALTKNNEPVLLMASVGAGKSLMLAHILLKIQKFDKRALCIVNNAELVRNNHATFTEQGGAASIYCAALQSKDCGMLIVFGTPQTILNGINKNEEIANIKFNLIIVDEAHTINHLNHSSLFIRILRHFKQRYDDMRLLGATGTNYRFKGTEIVGKGCVFKSQVGNITTVQLINEGYLVEPVFEVDKDLLIDFSKVRIKQNGIFDQKELAQVVKKSTRLTELICHQIVHIVKSQNRFGVFIFASTKQHAFEILSHLPQEESAIILGETNQNERTTILDKARAGQIKYLVNIAIISVGVDVPAYDTCAYLRPTESLVLLTQTMGRVLRLSLGTNKQDALILDFAGNIRRHQDWDDPILFKALKQIDEDKPHPIMCPKCETGNTEHARRCIGKPSEAQPRCDYFFEFKDCPQCNIKNDIASRHCRACNAELIDPNKRLSMDIASELTRLQVAETKYKIIPTQNNFRLMCVYKCLCIDGKSKMLYEHYTPSSDKARNVFYAQFIRKHCDKPSEWYLYLGTKSKMEEMIAVANKPVELLVKYENDKSYKIKKKVFVSSNSYKASEHL